VPMFWMHVATISVFIFAIFSNNTICVCSTTALLPRTIDSYWCCAFMLCASILVHTLHMGSEEHTVPRMGKCTTLQIFLDINPFNPFVTLNPPPVPTTKPYPPSLSMHYRPLTHTASAYITTYITRRPDGSRMAP